MTNKLYYGDNLPVLRESIASESVDLIYLDPPFNSNASYNVLFKAPSGEQSQAQIEAFEDTWHWNESAERAFDEVVTGPHSDASIMLRAMRSALGDNDMMAYLAMMAVRLIELHRVRVRFFFCGSHRGRGCPLAYGLFFNSHSQFELGWRRNLCWN
jgi:site-specific DNA-methyltransferase (adenine-specific)